VKDFHVKIGPFKKSDNSTRRTMVHLLIALSPIIVFAFYKNGIIPYQKGYSNFLEMFFPILFILLPTLTSFITELLYSIIFLKKKNDALKEYLSESFSIFPGLFLGLILPINTPISIVILGAFLATFVGKLLFGGFGNNIFNPALIGRLLVVSSYALVMSESGGYLNAYEIDTIASVTPLSNAVSGIGSYETLISPYGSLWDFFLGTIPGSLGETSSALCILGFIYLTITKVIKWKIPTTYILTVFMMTYMIGSINELGVWYPLFQVFSGGLMFGAIFMATDPVTSPTTPIGQILYGIGLGILTVIFRYLTPFPEGVLTSILTMNMLVFIIDKIGAKARFNFKQALLPFLIMWFLIIGIGGFIGNHYQNQEPNVDPDFNIISKEIRDNQTTYVVTQKGYSGILKASILFDKGVIASIDIISQNDSFFQKIEDNNYINKLIEDAQRLENIDAVSGATITSNALKQMVINTLNDYNRDMANEQNFSVLDHYIEGDNTIYEVSQKSFQGNLQLRIVFQDNIISSITVIKCEDSYFNLIINDDYIQKIITNQQKLDELDVVSGATISSNSLKQAITNTKKEYQKDYAK